MIQLWHNHFQELLESPLNITDDDEKILPIYNELDIKKGMFTIKEFNNATKINNSGKACGLDEIPVEV